MYKVNEIKISYESSNRLNETPKITSSKSAADILIDSWNKNEIEMFESFKVLYLNNSNKAKGIVEHSKGGITSTIVDVRIIMATALKSFSLGLILAHNHPSGNLNPSEADKNLTNKIVKAANYFDIKVLDHIIITPNNEYFSFRDSGFLP